MEGVGNNWSVNNRLLLLSSGAFEKHTKLLTPLPVGCLPFFLVSFKLRCVTFFNPPTPPSFQDKKQM